MKNPTPSRGPQRLAHLYADEYVGLGYLEPVDFFQYFKFSVVRNPWARVVSAYKFSLHQHGISFEDFVAQIVTGKPVVETRHSDARARFVCGQQSQLIVDQVLRFERLAEDFIEVSHKIFGQAEPLPVRNVSHDRRDYRSFYDDRTAELIGQHYRGDVDRFGYGFD